MGSRVVSFLSKEELRELLKILSPLTTSTYYLNENKFLAKDKRTDGDDLLIYQTIRMVKVLKKYSASLNEALAYLNEKLGIDI